MLNFARRAFRIDCGVIHAAKFWFTESDASLLSALKMSRLATARARPRRSTLPKRRSSSFLRSRYVVFGSRSAIVMFAALPDSGRPSVEFAARYALVAVKLALI